MDGDDSDKKDDDQQKGDDQKKDKPPKPLAKWPWIVVVVAFVAVIVILLLVPHARVKTGDAYGTVHQAMVAPGVAGQIDGVHVDDNQPVRAG